MKTTEYNYFPCYLLQNISTRQLVVVKIPVLSWYKIIKHCHNESQVSLDYMPLTCASVKIKIVLQYLSLLNIVLEA